MSLLVAPIPIDGESSISRYQFILGAAAACAVAEPLSGQDVLFASTLGKLLRDAALYETETVRPSPTSVTVIVGVGVETKPGMPFATDIKIALAVAWATVSDCISMAGLTAAMAAASAAASNCSFLRSAWLKSSVMPSRKMMGTIVSAVITATFALRSLAKRYNQARSIIFILIAVGPGRGNSLAFQGSRTVEGDRIASADLSAERNLEGWPLSNAYADRGNVRRSKIDGCDQAGSLTGPKC